MADLLLPEIVGPLVSGTIFASRIHHFFRIGSTNTAAMEAAAAGEPEGSVFFAEEQTAGRGRGSNTWESAPSVGIYCSVVLRPQLAPADALLLSLIAGIAVAEAVEQTTGLHPDLRWPNDVLIEERKFCGILTEMNAEATRVRYVVVGIGINVNHTSFSAELEPIATSLRIAAGHEWSRVQVAAALLKSLDTWYRRAHQQRSRCARLLSSRPLKSVRRMPARGTSMLTRRADTKALPRAWTVAAFCKCAPTAVYARCFRAGSRRPGDWKIEHAAGS